MQEHAVTTNENGWQMQAGGDGRPREDVGRVEQLPTTGIIASPSRQEASMKHEENCAELTGSAIGQDREPDAQSQAKREAEHDDG